MRSRRAGQFNPADLEDVFGWVLRVKRGDAKPTRKRYGKERRGAGSA